MADKNKEPKLVDRSLIGEFENAVPMGEYRLYANSAQLPSGIPWGGSDCQCVVIAASSYSSPPTLGVPSQMTPIGPIYLWRAFRYGPNGSSPYKVDDCLYYINSDDVALRIHSKAAPDHHIKVMSSSGLSTLMGNFNLPSGSSGKIDEYRAGSAYLDFEKPFWER